MTPNPSISQAPTDPDFVQNPWPFYDRMRALGPLVMWQDYGMRCAAGHAAVNAILRDRRFGREVPAELRPPVPGHLRPFYAVEDHSMLELEPPRHTRLRSLVLRAFTARRIAGLGPEVERLAHDLIDRFPAGGFDLLDAFCRTIPVVVICRMLGVPEAMKDQLLDWSHAMVAMYQAGRTRASEDGAARAAAEFAAFLRGYVDARRRAPADDLISELIAARDEGGKLSEDELITTCILLLNAGHEATVHGLGNGVKAILESGGPRDWLAPGRVEATVEEILRFDPPLHLFTRIAYEEVEVMGRIVRRHETVACLLAAAGRDPGVWADPHRFDPTRPATAHVAFGAGLHFCIGAPLARLEMAAALPVLFERCPGLRLAAPPVYADTYHFRGLGALPVSR
jgi:unspecific monooxygenase